MTTEYETPEELWAELAEMGAWEAREKKKAGVYAISEGPVPLLCFHNSIVDDDQMYLRIDTELAHIRAWLASKGIEELAYDEWPHVLDDDSRRGYGLIVHAGDSTKGAATDAFRLAVATASLTALGGLAFPAA